MGEQTDAETLGILKARFEQNMKRHEALLWESVEKKLMQDASKLAALKKMESSGGEPDVTDYDASTKEYVFCDCSAESPAGRRSLCYDREALDSRKDNKPSSSAVEMAKLIGIDILTEADYRKLQETGRYDLKTSSWIKTPDQIRKLGGALFCDRRYDHVFAYHNGADSYYAARGFRGKLRV